MQPQQPYTNPYDFIVSPQGPPRKKIVNINGTSPAVKIALIVVLFVVIVIALSIGTIILKGAGSGNVKNMESVAEDQHELMRIANEALEEQSTDIQQSTTLYFAQNTELSISSAQQRLISFLKQMALNPALKFWRSRVIHSLTQRSLVPQLPAPTTRHS